MSVLIETSLGEFVIDLNVKEAPRACQNFLKLCKLKKYNNCLLYNVQKDYLFETGDPTNNTGGTSIWGYLSGDPRDRYFEDELSVKKRFNKKGMVGMSNRGPNMNASGFFVTLTGEEIKGMEKRHTVLGEVVEGMEVIDRIN